MDLTSNLIKMKNHFLLLLITAILLFLFPNLNYSQAPNLGAAANFVFFTSTGAITGYSTISHINGGDVGTNGGAISGFENSTISGSFHNTDALTQQASKDILTAYFQIKNMAATNSTHANAFGGGEILLPGVYSLAGAISVVGILTLDGQNDANSVFIVKTTGGALTTADAAKVILINGASACNVAWEIEGAITFGAYANMQGTFISYNGALNMVAGSTLIGRGYSTTGQIGVNNVTVSIPAQCSDYIPTRWIGGTSSDWHTAVNWNNDIIPIFSSRITIPLGALPYPIVSAGIGNVQGIVIENGATLTVAGTTLKISGDINNSGTFDASAGTIEMNGITAQTIAANTFLNNTINNLIVSNNISLAGQQSITSSLSFGGNNKTLTSNNNLILKSTVLGTARLADLTNGGALSGNTITGKTTIERYISAKRAWRLLSVPISSVGAPTINAAWQEGQGGNSTSNPNPGFGVQITGGGSTNGFDQSINGKPSIKFYNTITNKLEGIPESPGTNIPITSYPGYFLFVRGDRSTNLFQGTGAALTAATIRIKGQIFTGDTIVSIHATNTTLVGNPYPSAIDFHALLKTNVSDKVYLWDPKMNGLTGIGGYVTLIWNIGGWYDKTSSASAGVSQYIQSGEAFFVESSNGATGSLTFKEQFKSAGGSDLVFKPMTDNKNLSLRVNLFTTNSAGSASLSDGVLTTYNDDNLNAVDRNDAKKLYNIAENICIVREAKNLAIERRKTIAGNDTTFLNLYNLKKQSYTLQLTAEGMDSIGLHAVIKDNYTGSLKDTALNMGGVTTINFTVNSDTASYAVNRFSIVFKQDVRLLPVVFSSVKAYQDLKNIAVKWTIENEFKIKKYTVEVASDNINFKTADTLYANANNNTQQSYSWVDKYVVSGMHYYRISATDILGKKSYSSVVNVNIDKKAPASGIAVYDILKANQFALHLNNIDQGRYNLKLYSMDGRIVNQFLIEHPGGNAINNYSLGNNFLPGKYVIILSGKNLNYETSLIIE